ncbi:MAG: phage minor head protein [Magnetovibrionaceae bacterium]
MPEFDLKAMKPEEAIRYFKGKGYAFSFDWRDVWQAEHAHAFTVAKVTRMDLLQDIRDALDKALEQGIPFEDFRKNLTPILQAKGWWGRQDVRDPLTGEIVNAQLGSDRRLRIIFDTNLRTAHSAGRWERIQRTAKRRPWLRYVSVRDHRTRREHANWHGTVLRHDDPWWQTHYPPNGWNCRCTVQQLSDRDLDRRGLKETEAPAIETKPYRNKRTGEVIDLPKGIDAGFGYHIGQAATRTAIDPARYTLDQLGHEAAELAVGSRDFRTFLKGKTPGQLPVGYLDVDLADAIGAQVRRVDLSQETMIKQIRAHPELKPEEYERLPDFFRRGRVIKDRAQTIVILKMLGRRYMVAVKATLSGKAAYLTSFRRLDDDREAARIERRGKVIREGGEDPEE